MPGGSEDNPNVSLRITYLWAFLKFFGEFVKKLGIWHTFGYHIICELSFAEIFYIGPLHLLFEIEALDSFLGGP